MQIRELVEVMAKALVDVPDSVDVREIEGEQSSVIELRVAREDLGKGMDHRQILVDVMLP